MASDIFPRVVWQGTMESVRLLCGRGASMGLVERERLTAIETRLATLEIRQSKLEAFYLTQEQHLRNLDDSYKKIAEAMARLSKQQT